MIKLFSQKKNSVLAVLCFTILLSMTVCAKDLVLVKDGIPQMDILIPSQASEIEQHAAHELQHFILQITGANLFIRNNRGTKNCIVLVNTFTQRHISKDKKTRLFPKDQSFLANSDGFAIRQKGDDIYIFATEPKGVLNGVYSFLEENTDIIWARPNELGTCFTKNKNLTATKIDYRERPVYKYRGWQFGCYNPYSHLPSLEWAARNRINYGPATSNVGLLEKVVTRRAIRGFSLYAGGHNLHQMLPNNTYFKKHPEWYGLVNGKRRPITGPKSTLCFTNKAMTAEIAQRVIRAIEEKFPITWFSICQMDGYAACECPECIKPINGVNNTVITKDDENFRSTQFFIFLNRVAEDVAKVYPRQRIMTLSYFLTTPPPAVKLHKNIWINFAPAMRCDKHTLTHPVNKKWKERINIWKTRTSNLIMREYYGCGMQFPRPLAETVAKDLQYLKKCGFKGATSETVPDTPYAPGIGGPLSLRWDASAMQMWLISKIYWNPEADIEKLRQQYLTRTFGPAAKPMGLYYKLIRDAWYASDDTNFFTAKQVSMADKYIKKAGNEESCRKALAKAQKLADTDQRKKHITAIRNLFESWMKELMEKPQKEVRVPKTKSNLSNNLDFSGIEWKNAGKIDSFMQVSKRFPNTQKTKVYLLHDNDNLYLGFECFDTKMKTINKHEKYKTMKRESFPGREESIELFFDGAPGNAYYQLAFGLSGTRYDGITFNKDWNGDWSVVTQVDKDAWRAVVTIPLKTINYNSTKGLKGHFYRSYHPQTKGEKEVSAWRGGNVHSPADFGDIILE